MNKKDFYIYYSKKINIIFNDIKHICKTNDLSITNLNNLKKELLTYFYCKKPYKKFNWKSYDQYDDFINYATIYFPFFEDLHYHYKNNFEFLNNTEATNIGYIVYKYTKIIEKEQEEYDEDYETEF